MVDIVKNIHDLDDDETRLNILKEELGKIGTYDERYKAMSKHGLATITNQDHMPAFSTLKDVYEEGKQNDLVEALCGYDFDFSKLFQNFE